MRIFPTFWRKNSKFLRCFKEAFPIDTLFTHVSCVTMDESMTVLTDAFVGITDGKITHLSKIAPPEDDLPKKIIDGTGMVMMPGLINCCTRLGASLLGGIADDRAADEALVFPREERLDARAVKAAALLSIAQCFRFGVTSVTDEYYYAQSTAEAAFESGIKINLAPLTARYSAEELDEKTDPACIELRTLHQNWHGRDGGRIAVEASVREDRSTPELWEYCARFAAEEGIGMQVCLSETKAAHDGAVERTGLSPAEVLDCHHVFDGRTTAAHCTHLTESDMRLLGKRGVSAVYCPASDLKQASGRADLLQMVKSGMNVALGTDSTLSGTNLDLFTQMRLAALEGKLQQGDPSAMPAQAALMLATVCGARAQGREKECGMLKIGMDADLCLLDFTQVHLIPCHDLMQQLVYRASGNDVVLTMVRGKTVYSAGTYPTIDLPKVLSELTEYAVPKVFGEKEDPS